jgi:hypothetical protein
MQVKLQLPAVLISELEGCEWLNTRRQLYAQTLLDRILGESPELLWAFWKREPAGNQTPIFRLRNPWYSHYTNRASYMETLK